MLVIPVFIDLLDRRIHFLSKPTSTLKYRHWDGYSSPSLWSITLTLLLAAPEHGVFLQNICNASQSLSSNWNGCQDFARYKIRLHFACQKGVYCVLLFFFFFCSGLPDLMVHPGLDEALNNYITCQFLPPFLQILQYICQAVHHFKALVDDCYTENSSFNVIIFFSSLFLILL